PLSVANECAPRSRYSIAARACTGPMPGSNCSVRKAASVLRGLSAQRSTPSRSLMWASSRKFRPPYFTKGTLRLASSTSRMSLWLALRKNTAWRLSGTLASRFFSTSTPKKYARLAFLHHLAAENPRLRLQVIDGHHARARPFTADRQQVLAVLPRCLGQH